MRKRTNCAAAAALLALSIVGNAAATELLWDTTGNAANYFSPPANHCPSSYDMEVADDFSAIASVEQVIFHGRAPICNNCYPSVNNVIVRFYERTASGPGMLQAEYILPGDSPLVSYYAPTPDTINVTLPTPFQATGWHFVSMQLELDPCTLWEITLSNFPTPTGQTAWMRDRLTGAPWEPQADTFGNLRPTDLRMQLYGTGIPTGPTITALNATSLTNSARIEVDGSGFGGTSANRALLVDGHPAIVTKWTDTRLIGYVPEAAGPGVVDVIVDNSGALSNAVSLDVQPRGSDFRDLWRVAIDAPYMGHRPGIAPDGNIYVNDIRGRVTAITADGAVLWVVDALRGQPGLGAEGPTVVGPDNTVYVAVDVLGQNYDLVALNPDGSVKWVHTVVGPKSSLAGPAVGPDGNVYLALNYGGTPHPQLISLDATGKLRWESVGTPDMYEEGAVGAELVFGPATAGGPIDQVYVWPDQNGESRIFAFDMTDGDQNWSTVAIFNSNYAQQTQGQVAVDPVTGQIYAGHSSIGAGGWAVEAFSPGGSSQWIFDPYMASTVSCPTVGPDGAIYVSWDVSRVGKANPDGSAAWEIFLAGWLDGGPVISPNNDVLVMNGADDISGPDSVWGLDPANGAVLWTFTFDSPEGINTERPILSADGAVAYVPTTVSNDPVNEEYCYVYALGTDSTPTASADLDNDGCVGFGDFSILSAGWGTPAGDIDGDGATDFADFAILASQWGAGC